jgi:hypothetical protein
MILRRYLHSEPVIAASYLFGCERRFSRALSEADRRAVTERMLREIPPRPPRAEGMPARNMGLTSGAPGA